MSTPTTPARGTGKARRPSDGPSSSGSSSSARSHGQSSPRVRMMLKEEEARPSALTNTRATAPLPVSTAASASAQPQQQQAASASADDENEDAGAKTFLTALVAAKASAHSGSKHTSRSVASEALRPPSPLEPMDEGLYDSSSGGGSGSGSEPNAQNYMGAEAMHKFWNMFHRHDAVSNNTSLSGGAGGSSKELLPLIARPKSARSTYLSVVRKLQLSPEPLGIVRRRVLEKGASSSASSTASSSSACSSGNTAQEINLNSYRMGDAYATAFSEGFALVPGVESLNLAHNRMSDAVAAQIITNAAVRPSVLQQLNLAHNKLSSVSSKALSGLLKQSKSLTSLNLSHTQLRDREILTLCEALQKNQTLVRLHLSENKFGIPGMVAIAKFLEENAKIEEVYLAWNQIRGVGALKIAEALKFHGSLRVVDLSWNSLDSNELLKPRSVVHALADSLANNKVLVHLDIANNHLDMDDCALLAKHLESNQTLIGLHMSGNCGVIDSRGFLIPKKTASKLLDQHKMYSIAVFEESHRESGSGAFPPHLAPLVDKFCWYCGQWSEYRFAWTPTHECGPFAGTSDRFEVTPSMGVRLHLCHDDWRGIDMEKREDGSFSAHTILPPGKTEYFFTVFLKQDSSQVSYHYIHEKRHSRLVHHAQCTSSTGDLKFVNIVRTARREGRDPCNTLVPRSTGKHNERTTRWDINKSVFARRKRESVCHNFVDTDSFVSKACAADWRQCKVDRFIKDPVRRKDVENCVTRHFRITSNAYRRFCGHNVLTSLAGISACTASMANQLQNDVISVPWSGYLEFLSECKILDEGSDYCKYADLENVFVAANLELTQEAKEKDNPDRSLTRFEFLECVIRIAMNKYHRTNVCDTPAKAVEKLILENIQPVCRDDPNEFRSKFLYTEEVSDIFSEHIVMLQDIYNSNMGKYCKPGEKKGMQLAEFLHIMERYQVYNDTFRVRDVKDPFLACKLVVLDEMATVGHKKLYMTDFMELLLRVSALRYPPKPLTVVEVAKGLQLLFINHFYKHEEILDQFRETVDQALVQDRIEAFASAINAQKKNTSGGNGSGNGSGKRGSGRQQQSRKSSQSVAEQEDEDEERSDASSDEETLPAAANGDAASEETKSTRETETQPHDETIVSEVAPSTVEEGDVGAQSHHEQETQDSELPAG